MRRLALATVMLVVLTGCVPTRPLPPQPTGDELDALLALELEYQWQYVGLTPDSPRPTIERIRVVSMNEAEAVHKQCMVDAGYETYSSGTAAVFGSTNFERLALYTCAAQYPVAPSNVNLFSVEQLNYLYDYYVTSAVPCLRAAGVRVPEVPSREEFVDGANEQLYSTWSPYGGLTGSALAGYIDTDRCPTYPDGFVDR